MQSDFRSGVHHRPGDCDGLPRQRPRGFYRNRREDAKKFLEHRHGKNYWVFNFCPVKENSYPSSVFDGRVSRYPFPDHHAPPLAILPLIAREIRLWLDGSPNRVAVLHSGKGRSGTMACAYLLALDSDPSVPRLDCTRTSKEQAKSRAEVAMNAMPPDEIPAESTSVSSTPPTEDPVKQEFVDSEGSDVVQQDMAGGGKTAAAKKITTNSLSDVLELHTSRRMKRPSSPSTKHTQGVSIPSQRRWLYYWSLLIAHQGPPGFWALDPDTPQPAPKVRLTQIKVRIHELSGVKTNLVRAANAFIDSTGFGKAASMRATMSAKTKGDMWVSLARYNDELVSTLEKWERHTRDKGGDMGKRRSDGDHLEGDALMDVFQDGKWDSSKMVRSFARLGVVGEGTVQTEEPEDGKITVTQLLRPLTSDRWSTIRTKIEDDGDKASAAGAGVESEETSICDATQTQNNDSGVVLDANREVFMGWFWFIPTFHMPYARSSAKSGTTMLLSKKEIDFPLGIGSHIVDVEVSMEWCSEVADDVDPRGR
ncbi:Phosphatidylinositol 3,4,5-trisphosphate 3-phosphatase and dual-specificity protein phosphatase PTEN [Grifola frondosa]|uniref:Phosphatidylinositol 3,4,5-trisphosphate 3-phosphatase and dual-specificity protein phosphatase PTEN n=1 Tax=Grifola frondosa TaxID=5627 RepID=A0A1C7MNB8_GRIFR|nr:Phosphatidylinositol 3,4,5-trisphosphate 3-phosphatase and dual-specificity protein phosphatase PTEN [Grifola frondosa]